MPEKPILHGRDHRPGGGDPIPGLDITNLPWGYARYANTAFASSDTGTPIDFNPAGGVPGISFAGGFTSGDAAITFGDNGTGHYSLIINATGFYLVGTGVRCQIQNSTNTPPADGSMCWLGIDWRISDSPVAGPPAQPFTLAGTGPGGDVPGNIWIADGMAVWPLNVDGSTEPVPSSTTPQVNQNSGVDAALELYVFAIKLSSITS
jgi:hypothetical protein